MEIDSCGEFVVTRWIESVLSMFQHRLFLLANVILKQKSSFKDFGECRLFIVARRGIANMSKYAARD
jgi:hypothetical protein